MAILLKPAEVARRRHTTVATLAQERFRGRGPRFLKDGGRILYDEEDLTKYLDECRRNPDGSPVNADAKPRGTKRGSR